MSNGLFSRKKMYYGKTSYSLCEESWKNEYNYLLFPHCYKRFDSKYGQNVRNGVEFNGFVLWGLTVFFSALLALLIIKMGAKMKLFRYLY